MSNDGSTYRGSPLSMPPSPFLAPNHTKAVESVDTSSTPDPVMVKDIVTLVEEEERIQRDRDAVDKYVDRTAKEVCSNMTNERLRNVHFLMRLRAFCGCRPQLSRHPTLRSRLWCPQFSATFCSGPSCSFSFCWLVCFQITFPLHPPSRMLSTPLMASV